MSAPRVACRSSARLTRELSDSHRSRTAPRAAGGSGVHPPEASTSRTASGMGWSALERTAPRSMRIASRTSRREKNRSPPRTR